MREPFPGRLAAALALVVAGHGFAQSATITPLAQFPPNQPTTFATPPGSASAGEFSKCVGHRDPATGQEYAIACAENGILFVEAIEPRHSQDNLSGVTFTSWFFAEIQSRWRGVASFRDYVYSVTPAGPGILRFRIDPTRPRAQQVTRLGIDPTTGAQLRRAAHRTTVDRQNGHLYVFGEDWQVGNALCVYDLWDETTQTVIDPPQLLAVWAPGGTIFDVYLRGNRAYLAYLLQPPATDLWRIIDVASLRANPPANPYSWQPPWGQWHGGLGALSHDSYLSHDGSTWFVNEEGGLITARPLGPTPPPLLGTSVPLPAVAGVYHLRQGSAPWQPVHSMRGIGNTGYVSHWTAGLHVLDLSVNPGGLIDYPLIASYDTSPLQTSHVGDGAWDCDPHQDSGVVYLSDSEEGLYLLRLDVGHLNRYGPGTPNATGVPRIEGNSRPPRIGRVYEMEVHGMQPNATGVLLLGWAEEPAYVANNPQSLLGATILVDPAVAVGLLFTADAGGEHRHSVPIPNSASFWRARLFSQALEILPNSTLAASRGTWFGIAQ